MNGFFAIVLSSFAFGQLPYRVIGGTESPRKHYAIGWGLKGKQIDWKRLANDDRLYLDSLNLRHDNAENYLIDTRAKKIVCTILGAHYWSSATEGLNHAADIVSWLPDERSAIVVFDGKWSFREVTAIRLRGGRAPLQLLLGEKIERFIRSYLDRNLKKTYRKYKDRIEIDTRPNRTSGKAFDFDLIAEVPKREDLFVFSGRFTVTLFEDHGKLKARLSSLNRSDGFVKKSHRIPEQDLALARSRRDAWLGR